VTIITHQATNMAQPPILRTYQMNMTRVGSKTMIVIPTPLLSSKEVTCLHLTKQYSNGIGNLRIIHVLVIFALRFSCSVLCPCSMITLRNEINFWFKFKLAIFSLPTSTTVGGMVT